MRYSFTTKVTSGAIQADFLPQKQQHSLLVPI